MLLIFQSARLLANNRHSQSERPAPRVPNDQWSRVLCCPRVAKEELSLIFQLDQDQLKRFVIEILGQVLFCLRVLGFTGPSNCVPPT